MNVEKKTIISNKLNIARNDLKWGVKISYESQECKGVVDCVLRKRGTELFYYLKKYGP